MEQLGDPRKDLVLGPGTDPEQIGSSGREFSGRSRADPGLGTQPSVIMKAHTPGTVEAVTTENP